LKKALQILIILTFGLNVSAQDVKIDPEIKVDSTMLKISQSDFEYFAYSSYDNKKTDSLIVSISTVGTSTTAIEIELLKNPKIYISLFSDYMQYKGKHIMNVDFESYELELNSTEFQLGDKIMGRIKGISKPIKNRNGEYQIKFEGEFMHIIGKLMIKKKADQSYRIFENE